MNEDFIIIKITAKIYHGFQHKMERSIFNALSFEEIVNEMKTVMKSFFHEHNLYSLEEGVDSLKLSHFHDDIPYNRPIVYLCDDNHGKDSEQP